MPSVSDGFELLTPALFELQLGVIAWPLEHPEDARDLPVHKELFQDRHLGERRDVVAVGDDEVVPAIVGRRSPVARVDRCFAADLVRVRIVAACSPRPLRSV